MNSRALTSASRRLRPSLRPVAVRIPLPIQRRLVSSEHGNSSNLGNFYKTFTRPVAKVLLLAVFTYQVAYWGWVKLAADEMKAEFDEQIAELEEFLSGLLSNSPAIRKAVELLEGSGIDSSALKPEELYHFALASPEEQERRLKIYAVTASKDDPVRIAARREELQRYQMELMQLEAENKKRLVQLRQEDGVEAKHVEEEEEVVAKPSSWWKFW